MTHGNKKKGWLLRMRMDGVTALKHIRLKGGLTSQAASQICQMSPGHYSRLENAQTMVTDVTLPGLEKLVTELGYKDDDKAEILG